MNKMAKANKVKEGKKSVKKNPAMLTFFIMLFPVLVLAMSSMVSDWVLKIALFFYEAILLKNFIDDHYKQIE
jgi:RsiW-degrading membrane proteinase PrsW (M82 family)